MIPTNPANLGVYAVEIKSATVTQDYHANPAVIMTYPWTNNSSETASAIMRPRRSWIKNLHNAVDNGQLTQAEGNAVHQQ